MDTVAWDDREGVRWIQLEGELDHDVCLAIREGFLEAALGGRGDVVVVLEGVGFLSSMGIGMLNDARQELARRGRALRLHGLRRALRRVLESIANRSGCTRRELEKLASMRTGPVCGRVKELLEAGLIEVSGTKTDPESGKTVETLRLVQAQRDLFLA